MAAQRGNRSYLDTLALDPLKRTEAHDWILLEWLTDDRLQQLGRQWFPPPEQSPERIESCRKSAATAVAERIAELEKLLADAKGGNFVPYNFVGMRVTKEERIAEISGALERAAAWSGLDPTAPKLDTLLKSVNDSHTYTENPERGRRPSVYIDRLVTFEVQTAIWHTGGYSKSGSQREWNGAPEWWVDKQFHSVAIEVKSAIPSYSEIIQQLQTYRRYVGAMKIAVVCPDDSLKAPLQKQGFLFVKCDPPPSGGPQRRLL